MHDLRAGTGWNAVLTTVYSLAFSHISSANSQLIVELRDLASTATFTVVSRLLLDVLQSEFGTSLEAPI